MMYLQWLSIIRMISKRERERIRIEIHNNFHCDQLQTLSGEDPALEDMGQDDLERKMNERQKATQLGGG